MDIKTECSAVKEDNDDNEALTSFLNDDNEMYDKMTEEEIDKAIVNCKQVSILISSNLHLFIHIQYLYMNYLNIF